MRVLSVASEVFPLVKTGGLADVVGALPGALAAERVEMRVMVPGYPDVMSALEGGTVLRSYADLFGAEARLVAGRAGGLDLIALDAPAHFARPGNPYLAPDRSDWPDNWQRFAALSRAAADVGAGQVEGFVPAVVHCHDWQSGLVPAYLRAAGEGAAKSVATIHNIAFQGTFPAALFPRLGLPASAWSIEGVEYHGAVGYLKAALHYADAITTVSPTYARRGVLSGIVNDIDTTVWDPVADPSLVANYTTATLGRRAANKRAVEEAFGLAPGDGMLFCVVSRLGWQKGMDILGACIDGLVAAGGRLAVLGSGEAGIEGMFHAAAARHPGRVGIATGYSEPTSHLLQGGADCVLVPSRFEPCGLTQFYGLRYGCVPLVSRVGGLADTVIDANLAALDRGVATGFQFLPVTAPMLAHAIGRAMAAHAEPRVWRRMQQNGMKSDLSWGASARRYADLYRALAG
ncbi:MAG: glycogen synthase GlgA [Rhizobiales bacterium]|nr:glycogen synthase GlgA [Hyphomicrobiales bacterium]